MIYLYTTNNKICKTVKEFLIKHNIKYIERNISEHPLSISELKKLSSKTENGIEDLINIKLLKENRIDLHQSSIKYLFNLIANNPQLMNTPIILNNNYLQTILNYKYINNFNLCNQNTCSLCLDINCF